MKATYCKLELLLTPASTSEWFGKTLPHITSIPGLIAHRFLGRCENTEVNDLRGMEVDFKDYLKGAPK